MTDSMYLNLTIFASVVLVVLLTPFIGLTVSLIAGIAFAYALLMGRLLLTRYEDTDE